MPKRVDQREGVLRHVVQAVRRADRQPQQVAQESPAHAHVRRQPPAARMADIAVVESEHAQSARSEPGHHLRGHMTRCMPRPMISTSTVPSAGPVSS